MLVVVNTLAFLVIPKSSSPVSAALHRSARVFRVPGMQAIFEYSSLFVCARRSCP